MRTKFFRVLIVFVLILSLTACLNTRENSRNREIILSNDNTNEKRNLFLTEYVEFFKQELPKRHKNLFDLISKKEFNDLTDQLIERIDQLNNKQFFVELNKIVASIGDAHTTISIWDGYTYPLEFWIFDEKLYVINADTSLEEMIFSQILKIDGTDIDIVIEQLTSLISHENESWALSMLPNYIHSPIYMYGLGIVENQNEAVFTVQKDGRIQDFTVSAVEYGESVNFVNNKTKDVFIGKFDKYYHYEYLSDHKALYFEYNVCADMKNQKFSDFNKEMFDFIEKNNIEKIVVDLRNNTGGNSEILNPFTKRLKSYIEENANVKVYILVGRNTFSSGMFAICRVKDAVSEAVSVGEPTGGAIDCYGDVKTIELPNSQISIGYSTKYFKLSKNLNSKNDNIDTFLPDIFIQPTIEDYMSETDVVLDYVLKN